MGFGLSLLICGNVHLKGCVRETSTNWNRTVQCEAPANRCDINVTDVEADLIARNNLRNLVDIPGIPDAIEKPVLEEVIKAFIRGCPLVLPEGVFNKLVSGEAGVE